MLESKRQSDYLPLSHRRTPCAAPLGVAGAVSPTKSGRAGKPSASTVDPWKVRQSRQSKFRSRGRTHLEMFTAVLHVGVSTGSGSWFGSFRVGDNRGVTPYRNALFTEDEKESPRIVHTVVGGMHGRVRGYWDSQRVPHS